MAGLILHQFLEYQVQGQRVWGYLARPRGEGRWPGIVVIQEWWGLQPHMLDMAQRFAREGYAALALDLYHGMVTNDPQEAMELSRGLDKERAVREIEAGLVQLKALPFSSGRAGVIGYCMGGGLSFLTGVKSRMSDATIVYYGPSPEPIEQVKELSSPFLGIYGELDVRITPQVRSVLEPKLKEYHKDYEIYIYPGALHAFFNETRENFHPQAAKEA